MALAALAALAGAAVQSAVGFGFALVLTPALFAVMEPAEAVMAGLLLGAALSAVVVFESRYVSTHGLARLLLSALPGLAVGALLLSVLSKEPLQVGVGVAVIAAAAWQLRSAAERPRVPAAAAGFASGALTTSIGINGPPLVLWLESQRTEPAQFRATLAAAFLVLDVAGAALLASTEGLDVVDLGALGPLLACVLGGYVLGALAFRRLDADRFFTLVLTLVICTGLASVAAGIL
jgi:uncharacterized membrane protein YfcA